MAFKSRRVEAKHARFTHGRDATSLPLKVESGCLVSARAVALGSSFRRKLQLFQDRGRATKGQAIGVHRISCSQDRSIDISLCL